MPAFTIRGSRGAKTPPVAVVQLFYTCQFRQRVILAHEQQQQIAECLLSAGPEQLMPRVYGV